MDYSIRAEFCSVFQTLLLQIDLTVVPVIIVIIALLAISALVSGSEVAFFSLTHEQIEDCKANSSSADKALIELATNPKLLLSTILILNNLVNVAIVTITTFMTWRIVGKEAGEKNGYVIAILTFSITTAIVFFGEVLPKVFATKNNVMIARLSSRFLNLSSTILYPLSWVLMSSGDLIEKKIKKKSYNVSVNDLNEALELTTSSSDTTSSEKDILKGIVNFGTYTAKQVMRSRLDIMALEINTPFDQVLEYIREFGYSRIPVYKENLDKIEGILYIKELLPYLNQNEDFNWQTLIRSNPFFIPENKKIDDLLKDFQQKRVHMAIVVDEYGGTQGLITMEDIIEEIVGEINDEFDTDDIHYKSIDPKTFIFEGKTSINDFCKILEIDQQIFAEAKGENESLGGLLLELFSRMPKPGESVNFEQFIFTVVSVDKKRIKTIRVFNNKEEE